MSQYRVYVLPFVLMSISSSAVADFGGPLKATSAMSPDGNTLVRVTRDKSELVEGVKRQHRIAFYQFDPKKDSFIQSSGFKVEDLCEFLFVSDSGDLVMVSLTEKESIRIYAKSGKLLTNLACEEFLSADQIAGCARTGSTLQWFEEGRFGAAAFHFRGPASIIRALQPPYTVMKDYDEKVKFAGTLDLKSLKVRIY